MSDQTTAAATGTAGDPGATGTPAGWYADPQGAMRWWDGTAWTTHVAAGSASSVTRTATILSTRAPELPPSSRLPRLPRHAAGVPRCPRCPSSAGGPGSSSGPWSGARLLAGYLLFGRGGDDDRPGAPVAQPPSPRRRSCRVVDLQQADVPATLGRVRHRRAPCYQDQARRACVVRSTATPRRRTGSPARRPCSPRTARQPDRRAAGVGRVREHHVASATQAMAERRRATDALRTKTFRVHLGMGTAPVRFTSLSSGASRGCRRRTTW